MHEAERSLFDLQRGRPVLVSTSSGRSREDGVLLAAVEGLTRGLAIDFSPTRVNAVSPGAIDTPLWGQLPPEARKAHYERIEATLPVRRMGQPEDVGQAILMLMGNPFTTGVVLQVDGGSMLL